MSVAPSGGPPARAQRPLSSLFVFIILQEATICAGRDTYAAEALPIIALLMIALLIMGAAKDKHCGQQVLKG